MRPDLPSRRQGGGRVPEKLENRLPTCRRVGQTPYDMRRTAIRNRSDAGVPDRDNMAISGHRTRAVFDRYNIVSEKGLRDAMVRMADYVETLPDVPNVVPIAQGQK